MINKNQILIDEKEKKYNNHISNLYGNLRANHRLYLHFINSKNEISELTRTDVSLRTDPKDPLPLDPKNEIQFGHHHE